MSGCGGVDLGPNIHSGAHYTQFQVYDYDGDGQADIAAKTADGSVDGEGTVIGDGGANYANDDGYVLDGPEFLTMFDGATGAALDTVEYVPPRGTLGDWGDDYGNRADRFLAGTAYLDGKTPSLISARGYYTRSVIAAWDFADGKFSERWVFDSNDNSGYAGQGSHSLSVADADGDGNDEVMYGSMAVDDDGSGLWNAGTGHGDAQHVGDLDPGRDGLEEFKVSEDSSQPGSLFLDAASGEVLWKTDSRSDNGRGVSADVWAGSLGAESWSAADGSMRDPSGAEVGAKPSSINFVSWWDGDPVRELLDGTHIDKYGPDGDKRLLTGEGVHANNGSKANPALSGTSSATGARKWCGPPPTTPRCGSTPHRTRPTCASLRCCRTGSTAPVSPGRTPPTTSRRTPASSSATARTPPPGPRSGPRSRRPARPCRPGNGSRRCRPAPDGLGCRCAGHGCRRTDSGRP